MAFEQRMRRIAWVFFVLMWVPFGFMILAAATDEDMGDIFRPLVLFFLLCALFAVLFILSFRIGRMEKDRIRRTGIAAKATIVSIRETGTTVNDQPLYAIELEVQPPYDARFQTTVEYFIPYPGPVGFAPGSTVRVFYREDTREVAIDGL